MAGLLIDLCQRLRARCDEIRRLRLIKDLATRLSIIEPIRKGDAFLPLVSFRVLRWQCHRRNQQLRGQRFDPASYPAKKSQRNKAKAENSWRPWLNSSPSVRGTPPQRRPHVSRKAAQLRAEITALRKANKLPPNPILICPNGRPARAISITLLGRGRLELGSGCTEEEVQGMPNETGTGFVDYVLWETTASLSLLWKPSVQQRSHGCHQAELYANCLNSALANAR